MTDPTPDQLLAFFQNVENLRQYFQQVDVIFTGANETPLVRVYWTKGLPASAAVAVVQSATDNVDDLNNLLNAAVVQYRVEGNLRNQILAAQAQVDALSAQLAADPNG